MTKEKDHRKRDAERNKERDNVFERIIHDEEFGEENVEQVDSEWADFERFFRYTSSKKEEIGNAFVLYKSRAEVYKNYLQNS